MRLFRAAFGDDVLAELLEREARDWRDVSVQSISSGHSGAFMLVIRGVGSGRRSLVVKIAKDEKIIDHEVRAVSDYLASLGPLNGELCALDAKGKQSLLIGPAFYYCQAEVDGVSLLDSLRADVSAGVPTLEHVIRLCIRVCESASLEEAARVSASIAFPLSAVDLGRLNSSIDFQRSFGRALEGRLALPDLPFYRWCDVILGIANDWSDSDLTKMELPMVVQHGDLNPANVMVRHHSSPVLIDFARLKPWPVGYDLGRLSVMLRLRLVGSDTVATEWFGEELLSWLDIGVATSDEPTRRLCPAAAACDTAFENFVSQQHASSAELLRDGYLLGKFWDLLKIISYQDISPFKRYWSVCMAGSLADLLMSSRVRS
jgi:hypothetical protein